MKTTTHLSEALEQISSIHEHLAKSEIYRGFRSIPIALAGVGGIVAALIQPNFVAPNAPEVFLRYWIVTGALCALISASEIVFNYVVRENRFVRRQSRQALGQFVPSLVAAAGLTAVLARTPQYIVLLPGLWATLFGLGIFASRMCLPHVTGWVAVYYVCAGWWLWLHALDPQALNGMRVGGVFGVGQLASALVLYWNLERKNATNADER